MHCLIYLHEADNFLNWLKDQGVAKCRRNGRNITFAGHRFTANKNDEIRFNARTRWLGYCYNWGITIAEYKKGMRHTMRLKTFDTLAKAAA